MEPPNISYAYVGGIRELVVQIPSMDTILMVYLIAVQVSTMMISVMYKSKFSMVK